ncbi:MAG TPA: HIT family protein [Parvularculaceae bacterium]|nr:HIT family protein [Parvularculaceae bacterium]
MTERQKYDPDNIFAKILRRDLPCIKIYEDDAILAFMDIFPQSEGHALVIPKRAKATMIFDIDPDELATLTAGVQKVAKAIDRALRPDGLRVIQFNGPDAGQTVFHIHFHIVPIYAGKPLRPHAGGAPADEAALTEIASKIAAAL